MRYTILISIISTLFFSSCNTVDNNNIAVKDTLKVLTTRADRSMELIRSTEKMHNNNSNLSEYNLTIDSSVKYQTMDGFGAAITGSTCFNLMQMSEANRNAFIKETFDSGSGYGFSYIRISIGCSDFSLSEYTCCDTPGIENFSLQEEEIRYIIPVLKEILSVNPAIKILGSPWTAPQWMKVKDLQSLEPFPSWTSGHLNPIFYQDYAIYFSLWIDAMKQHGIDIYAVTPQNEPLNRGNSASMFMGWQEQCDFIKSSLGPVLKTKYPEIKIYAFDHNYNYDDMIDQSEYPLNIYHDTEASVFLDGAAFHNYGGVPSELLNINAGASDKELIFTETSIGTWNDGRNLSVRLIDDMDQVALSTVNNYCKGVIVWNLMLDTDRGPNRDGGCQTCYGAVDIDIDTFSEINKNSHYFIIAHLSAYIKPGAIRIDSKLKKAGSDSALAYMTVGINYSAFENPDGTIALIVMNASVEIKDILVSSHTNLFTINVEAHTVKSYLWR